MKRKNVRKQKIAKQRKLGKNIRKQNKEEAKKEGKKLT